MKVAILTQYYPPEIGAPQARLSELVNGFVSRGHEVIVLTAMPSYPLGRIYEGYTGLFRWESKGAVQILRVWAYPTKSLSMVKRLASYFSFVFSSFAAGFFALPRVDYLITESPPLFLGLTGYLLSFLKGARWIFNVSDLWPETAVRLGALSPGWKLAVSKRLEAFCYRKAWLVSGQSREIVGTVSGGFPGVATYHLSNGVNLDMFRPVAARESIRRHVGFEGFCIALYAGLHGLAQGLLQVLRAADLLRNVPDLRFVFVGDGPDKEVLMATAREMGLENVQFLPPMPRDQMPAIVSAADIGLVPLKVHLPGAVPSKLYEYMASGLPVVLAAEGEPARIVRECRCGIAVAPEDPQSFAMAVLELVRNQEKRANLGDNGRAAAGQFYDRSAISRNFVSYLEKSAGSSRNTAAPAETGNYYVRDNETAGAQHR